MEDIKMTYTKIGTPFLKGTNKAVAGKQYLVLNDADSDFPKGYVVKAVTTENFSCDETGATDCYMFDRVELQEIVVGTQPQTILSKHAEDGKTYIVQDKYDSDFPVGTKVTYRSSVGEFISVDHPEGMVMWDTVILQEITSDTVLVEIAELRKQVAALENAYVEKLLAEPATPEETHITQEEYDNIKVGDTVVIRSDLEENSYGRNAFVDGMEKYRGKEVIVKADVGDKSGIKVEGSTMGWTKEMIHAVIPAPKYAIGQTVWVTEDRPNNAGLSKDEEVEVTGYFFEPDGSFRNYKVTSDQWYVKEEYLTAAAPVKYLDAADLKVGDVITFDGDCLSGIVARFGSVRTGKTLNHLSAVMPTGGFFAKGINIAHNIRYATAEEIAKLEAAEQKAGYTPPVINKLGTVFEAGQYVYYEGLLYPAIVKVKEVREKVVYLEEFQFNLRDNVINKEFFDRLFVTNAGRIATEGIPATKTQIAVYEAAVALHSAQEAMTEAQYQLAA